MLIGLLGRDIYISVSYMERLDDANKGGPKADLTAKACEATFTPKSISTFSGPIFDEKITVALSQDVVDEAMRIMEKARDMTKTKFNEIAAHLVATSKDALSWDDAMELARGHTEAWFRSGPRDAAELYLINKYDIVNKLTAAMRETKLRKEEAAAAEAKRIRIEELAKRTIQDIRMQGIMDDIIREASGVDPEDIKQDTNKS